MSRAVPSIRRVALVSLLVDLVDIVTNLVVAAVTGSAVIFAEMAQGIADAIGSLLLVVGERRSRLPDDPRYPAGHSREVFFWALLSSMVMLVVGSGLSFWRGYQQLTRLEPLSRPYIALAVLVLSVTTNGYAVSLSRRRLRASGLPLRRAFREESQPLVKTAFLQDGLGTASAVVGLCSLVLYSALGAMPLFDALGAVAIACLMVAFSIALIVQVHHLIAGRPVPWSMRESVRRAVLSVPEVEAVNRLDATFAGSAEIDVELDLDLREELTTGEIEHVFERVRDAVVSSEPRAIDIHVHLSSPGSHADPCSARSRPDIVPAEASAHTRGGDADRST